MPSATAASGPEIVRWYTLARKFPKLIGRTSDGTKLWGGPYTITQVVGGGLVLFLGANTMPLWATHGLLGNLVILGMSAYGVMWLLGRIPIGARNPLAVVAGAGRALSAPRHGRLGGHPIRIRRPRRLRHRVRIALPPPTVGSAAGHPPAERTSIPAHANRPARSDPVPTTSSTDPGLASDGPSRRTSPAALTGVQALLAGGRPGPESGR